MYLCHSLNVGGEYNMCYTRGQAKERVHVCVFVHCVIMLVIFP